MEQLKQSLPNSKNLQAAAMTADVIKAQRKAAKQLMSRPDASLADLNQLMPQYLRLLFRSSSVAKRDAAYREMSVEPKAFQFNTPQARQGLNPQQAASQPTTFIENNAPPELTLQQKQYQTWRKRQDQLKDACGN